MRTARSIDISLEADLLFCRFMLMHSRGGPPSSWWNLETDPCWLMNSRGVLPFGGLICWWVLEAAPFWGAVSWWTLKADPLMRGCMLMNYRGGPLLGAICWWILELDPHGLGQKSSVQCMFHCTNCPYTT